MKHKTDCKKMIGGSCFAECTNEGTDECCHRCSFYDPDFNPRKCIKELMTHYSARATQGNCKIVFARLFKILGSESDRILGTDNWITYYTENINPDFKLRGSNFWTPERTATVKSMVAQELTIAQIAKTIGNNYNSTQQKIYQMRKRGEIA